MQINQWAQQNLSGTGSQSGMISPNYLSLNSMNTMEPFQQAEARYNFMTPGGYGTGPSQHAMDQFKLANIQADAAKYPAMLQMERFNKVFPFLESQFGKFAGGGLATAGGSNQPGPTINAGPIWSPQQIQQQTNAAYAANDRRAATQGMAAKQRLAGAGFGSASPLGEALTQGYQNQALAANSQAAREIGWNAAQGNANQMLQGQQLQEVQAHNRNQEDIERRKPYWQALTSMWGSLSGLV